MYLYDESNRLSRVASHHFMNESIGETTTNQRTETMIGEIKNNHMWESQLQHLIFMQKKSFAWIGRSHGTLMFA